MITRALVVALIALLCGCGIYTFSGSTLPNHLNTVDIPLFENRSLKPRVGQDITESVTEEVVGSNLLRVVGGTGDATITGTVRRYTNHPRTYSTTSYREVDVSEYMVTITVEVVFMDNVENKALYEGTITGEGIYDFQNETEEDGREEALEDIVRQIIQNSVQSW
ncbi:MAG: hypothetical protein GF344_09840 [Chitinivibrionales bacterium]|nr:hypothetical protein [Chitinivibrionales bacterium]MBD3357141.1 hypothetical protein [Chitinivibrionales bacterium]